MKCQCGNELGKPLVSPRPIVIVDEKTKKEISLLFMAGIVNDEICYFCWIEGKGL